MFLRPPGDAIRHLRAPESSIESSTQAVEHLLTTAEEFISTGHQRFASPETPSTRTTMPMRNRRHLFCRCWNRTSGSSHSRKNGVQLSLIWHLLRSVKSKPTARPATPLPCQTQKPELKRPTEQLETGVAEKQSLQKRPPVISHQDSDELARNHLADALTLDPNNAKARLLTMVLDRVSSAEPLSPVPRLLRK
jgi:hypothetical protein